MDTLWLFHSSLQRDDIDLAVPTIAWIAAEQNVLFECYLESERDGSLFARTGSTVLGGYHFQQFNYLEAAYDVKHIVLGDDQVFGSSILHFGSQYLAKARTLPELYEVMLSYTGEAVFERLAVFGDPVPETRELTPYFYPDIFFSRSFGVFNSQIESLREYIVPNSACKTFLLEDAPLERLRTFCGDTQSVVSPEGSLKPEGVTVDIAGRWKQKAEGYAFGDADAIRSALPALCRERKVALYAPVADLPLKKIDANPYAEQKSALAEKVADLAAEKGNFVITGRQTGDGDILEWSRKGVAIQIMDPNRPAFPIVASKRHEWKKGDISLFADEPSDEELEQWADQGRVAASIVWHSGEMAHNEAMANLIDLVSFTGVKFGVGVHSARYTTCPQLWELISISRERGGARGCIEPVLHSGGMGVLAEKYCPPDILAGHCRNSLTEIKDIAGEHALPKGYLAFLDTDLVTFTETAPPQYEKVSESGLEYLISSARPGRNRIIWQDGRMVVINQSCRTLCMGSPYVRITNLEDILETNNRMEPAWIVAVMDAPVIAFNQYIWRHGSRFMRIVDWLLHSGRVVNVLPHTVSRYARVLEKKGYLPAIRRIGHENGN